MFSVKFVVEDILSILTVVPSTLAMAFVILIAGILVGVLLAEIKRNRVPILEQLVGIYLAYIRGIPLIVHLYIAYYAFPQIVKGIADILSIKYQGEFSPVLLVVITYSLYTSAVQSENIRAALLSVDHGQYEAACAIGLNKIQAMFRIVFPQALAVAVPVFFNIYLGIIKGLSLAFTVSVVDILAQAKICSALNYRYLESYVAAGAIYWALCGLLTVFFYRLENRYYAGRRGRKYE